MAQNQRKTGAKQGNGQWQCNGFATVLRHFGMVSNKLSEKGTKANPISACTHGIASTRLPEGAKKQIMISFIEIRNL